MWQANLPQNSCFKAINEWVIAHISVSEEGTWPLRRNPYTTHTQSSTGGHSILHTPYASLVGSAVHIISKSLHHLLSNSINSWNLFVFYPVPQKWDSVVNDEYSRIFCILCPLQPYWKSYFVYLICPWDSSFITYGIDQQRHRCILYLQILLCRSFLDCFLELWCQRNSLNLSHSS